MEPIKTSDNVEFDVIYADGTRHRVHEGIFFEVDGISMVCHNGTDRLPVIFAAAESALELIDHCGGIKQFAEGMWNALPDVPGRKALMKILIAFYPWPDEKRGIFRLGQMDMRAAACDMLREMATSAAPQIRTGLTLAADLVESLEVINGDC